MRTESTVKPSVLSNLVSIPTAVEPHRSRNEIFMSESKTKTFGQTVRVRDLESIKTSREATAEENFRQITSSKARQEL